MNKTDIKELWKSEFFRPVKVLVGICFFVTLALALTNFISAPIIKANAEKNAIATRKALLAEADAFSDVTDTLDLTSVTGKAHVTEAYKADNGSGAVFTVETSSFGGALTMMVGVNKDGEITGVQITDHEDTPGVGTKNFADEHLAQYAGMTSLTSQDAKKEKGTTGAGTPFAFISGASVTGTAIHSGVYEALDKFAALG